MLISTLGIRVALEGGDDALIPSSRWFGLGAAFGMAQPSCGTTPPAAIPFGASLAVTSEATGIDFAVYGFDTASQTATVTIDGAVLPVLKHTTGTTKTRTDPDGTRMNDSDDDQQED
ncbi:hypothetical protein Afil01_69250 [Actinorhabdospora filicis]|uniref:Uncharacterized protein n=1 Tax=Actinorhabdospora filicis TaxID=1785913 RepID=A0A9W6WDI6_9ACTN|nr:hypothetical protein [Actinorhabdospora filicis]GLZ82118.1 hypothetical protein Afil01_69250 [Actinorhabdospora filicis]